MKLLNHESDAQILSMDNTELLKNIRRRMNNHSMQIKKQSCDGSPERLAEIPDHSPHAGSTG